MEVLASVGGTPRWFTHCWFIPLLLESHQAADVPSLIGRSIELTPLHRLGSSLPPPLLTYLSALWRLITSLRFPTINQHSTTPDDIIPACLRRSVAEAAPFFNPGYFLLPRGRHRPIVHMFQPRSHRYPLHNNQRKFKLMLLPTISTFFLLAAFGLSCTWVPSVPFFRFPYCSPPPSP